MRIFTASEQDILQVMCYDRHIAKDRLELCLQQGMVYALSDGTRILGVLRYSMFWQSIPFVDLLYIDEAYQLQGHGKAMMQRLEQDMLAAGYRYVMLSTQADETAKHFYEKLGYHLAGAFLPPEQDADELIYWKELI